CGVRSTPPPARSASPSPVSRSRWRSSVTRSLRRVTSHDVERAESKGTAMIVDVHGHLVPPDLIAAIRKERFPSLRQIEDGGALALAFAGGKPSRAVMPGLSDVAGRLARVGKQGIDRPGGGGRPRPVGYPP